MHLAAQGGPPLKGQYDIERVVYSVRVSLTKQRLKEKQRAKFEEAFFLLRECNVPMHSVAKRLKLSLR